MLNPLFLLFILLHLFFLFSTAAVVFHLLKYQLNKSATRITTALFLSGAGILLLLNFIIALNVEWSEFSIIF